MNSTADPDDVIEVSDDGLIVRKRFVADEFPVPTIRFDIESDRNDPVSFRLTERIPPTFPMDGVGFHPDYHSGDWRAFQDHHLEFNSVVGPGESLVTVYGIRLDDETDPRQFLTEPAIDETGVERSADTEGIDDGTIDDIIARDNTQPVKDMLAGESHTVPGLDGPGRETDDAEDGRVTDEIDFDLSDVDPKPKPVVDDEDEDVPDVDLGFGEDDVLDADSTDDPEIELDLDAAAASVDGSNADGSVVARLADELREGDVDEADRDRIRSALGAGLAGSDVAKIDHLQSRVEEVAAYTDALEEFLDEEGTGTQLIEELRDELASFDDQLSSFGTELSSFEDDLSAMDDRLEDVDTDVVEVTDRVTDIDGDLRNVKTDIRDVETDLRGVKTNLRDVETGLEEVTETVTDLVRWRDQLGSMFTE